MVARVSSAVGGATLAVVASIAFFVQVNRLPSVDPLSSTDALKYLVVPVLAGICAPVGGVVGYLLGRALDVVFRRRDVAAGTASAVSTGLAIAMVALLALVIEQVEYARAKGQQEATNALHTPGIKSDAGSIRSVRLVGAHLTNVDLEKDASHRISFDEIDHPTKKTFAWGARSYEIEADRSSFVVRDVGGGEVIRHSVDEYDWIAEVSFLPVELSPTKDLLFVLSDLRPTSQKSILSVFSRDGGLVYEELFDRANVLETGEMDGVGRIVVLGRLRRSVGPPAPATLAGRGYMALGSAAP